MNIYIDESGCLGFNFKKRGTSKYLIFTALVIQEHQAQKAITKAIQRTLKNKIKHRKNNKETKELKGHAASLAVKKYFYKQIQDLSGWELYAVIVNKAKQNLENMRMMDKATFYDEILITLIKEITFPKAKIPIPMIIDKSKNANLRAKLNMRLKAQVEKYSNTLIVFHQDSSSEPNLQAVDLFCAGVARKFELADDEWFRVFEKRIKKIKIV